MPIVQIELIEGRTVEQKRVLAEKVTRAIVESLSCPETAVSIIMREMQTDNFAKAGKLWCDK
ncbi:MAG TPA: 4-oxalocrotonate tautomerase [Firmicutes bacterium]|jgi:4-oxalocrotonate tautomerase|nr:4-oxalocrotonate tautomerase [Bacillota bacterium]